MFHPDDGRRSPHRPGRPKVDARSSGSASVPSEAEPFWSAVLKGLVKRGLKGVKLVISDAHEGLRYAISRVLGASWQRCRVHWVRNALAHVPKSQHTMVVPFGRRGAIIFTSVNCFTLETREESYAFSIGPGLPGKFAAPCNAPAKVARLTGRRCRDRGAIETGHGDA